MQATQRKSIGGFSPLTGMAAVVAITALVVAAIGATLLGSALVGHGLGSGTAPVAGAAPKAASATDAQIAAALVEVRRGEREPLFAANLTSAPVGPGFSRLIPR